MGSDDSFLGKAYQSLYDRICGVHPYLRPWHFQWNVLRDAHKWQKKQMILIRGKVLDVGCGNKPYKEWCDKSLILEYVGLDIPSCSEADIKVEVNEQWPLPSESFDSVIMTQSLEHVENMELTLQEVRRVLKVGGYCLLTVPFLNPEHGAPYDFRRFTVYGIENLTKEGFEIISFTKAGRFGSVLAVFILDFVEKLMNTNFLTRLIKGIVFPLWIVFSNIVNVFGILINYIDSDGSYYCNSCFLIRRK